MGCVSIFDVERAVMRVALEVAWYLKGDAGIGWLDEAGEGDIVIPIVLVRGGDSDSVVVVRGRRFVVPREAGKMVLLVGSYSRLSDAEAVDMIGSYDDEHYWWSAAMSSGFMVVRRSDIRCSDGDRLLCAIIRVGKGLGSSRC
ncbi:MAG: hypothetical protein GXO32_00600 [Crenarchaeota archaeon]|nr:hypothetical protein [Thermoproteota archaeon]